MGTIALRYTRPVIGTFFLESSIVVDRAMICVMSVANARCHVVNTIASLIVRIHLYVQRR